MVIELAATVFAFLAVTGATMSVLRGVPVSRTAEKRLEALRAPPSREGLHAGDILRRGSTSVLPPMRSLLSNSAWSERAAIDLQRAGLSLKVSEYLLLRLMASAAGFVFTILIIGASVLGFLLSVGPAALGFMLPSLYVRFRKERRANAISGQMVETLQLISNALISGFAFTQAVEMAAKQLPPPMHDELNQFLRDNALGSTTDEALRSMATRAGSRDLDMAVTAILVQRTTGGNLAEVLESVAETMRERARIQGEIRTLTAHQRFTGVILSLWPLLLGLLFFALVPSQMLLFFTDPIGRVMLGVGIGLQLVGAYSLRRLMEIDI